MTEFGDDDSSDDTEGGLTLGEGNVGESIVEHGSRLGLEPEEVEDYWYYNAAAATWTRTIVVPRVEFYLPSEGAAYTKSPSKGPDLSYLRDTRWTIPEAVTAIRYNWRMPVAEDGPSFAKDGIQYTWT